MNAEEAMNKIKDGNKHFVAGTPSQKDFKAQRAEVVSGQKPYVIVLTCSDSRVPPEHIFDAGIGEIFVIRTAGNIADAIAIGSIEYAAEHCGTPLLVVLGHESCGAIKATCGCRGEAEGNIGAVVREIADVAKANNFDAAASVPKNVECVIRKLREKSPVLSRLEKEGRLRIAGAVYSLSSGEVKFL